MKRCTRCVLPEGYPGIEFNEEGVCNYCLAHEPWIYKGKEELDKFLEPLRNRSPRYDCIIGISGGRDSSYALWYLVKICNLRVLAYNSDNQFTAEGAKINVKKMTDMLDVELVAEDNDLLKRCVKTNVSSWLRRPSPAMIPMICCGCRLGAFRGILECARRNEIPLVVLCIETPLETGQLKRALLAADTLGVGGRKPKSLAFGLLQEVVKNPFYLSNPINTFIYVTEYLHFFHFARLQRLFYPNQRAMLDLYRYIEWNEDKILTTLKTELDWKRDADSASSWRFDCKISSLKNYLLRELTGATEKDDGLSAMIREKMITREEALERLGIESVIPQELIAELLDEIGLGNAEIMNHSSNWLESAG